ncbi:MAG: LysR family transcriptional regulator [Spirochaetales bacterium]
MDIIKLRAFYTVATLQSISEAAKQLNYTQPAISAQIRELENELKLKLFERRGRNVRLSEGGKLFLSFAETLLKDFEACKNALQRIKEQPSSQLRIGASALPGMYLLPDLLGAFISQHLGITFSLNIQSAYQIERMLFDQQIDVGFLGRKKAYPEKSVFHPHLLLKDRHVLVVSPQHALARQDSVNLKTLSEIPLILPPRNTVTRRSIESAFRKAGVRPPIIYEVSNIETIKRMVTLTPTASILCNLAVQKELSQQTLAALPIEDFPLVRFIYVVTRKAFVPTVALETFLTFVLEAYRF